MAIKDEGISMNPEIFSYVDLSSPSMVDKGPLTGKKIAIQPNLSVRGWPADAGSVALERFVALEDATVIERLKKAGARLAGSTRMSELGLGLTGDTGARALAEGQVDAVLMTDTLGEPRVAASTIGAFGFKPSYGIVSRYGLIGLMPSMKGIGILAKSPGEIAAISGVIVGKDNRDFSMSERGIPEFSQVRKDDPPSGTYGIIREYVKGLDVGESKVFQEAIAWMERSGLRIQEVSLADFELFRTVHQVVGSVEASSSSGKYDGVRYGHRAASSKNWNEMYLKSRAESFGLMVKAYLFQGAYFQFENYTAFENACRIRRRLVEEVKKLCERVDGLVLPVRGHRVNAAETGTLHELYGAFAFALLANVTGQPSLAMPNWVAGKKTDLGLQFIGPWLGDAKLLSVAAGLLRHRGETS